jgi:small ligand-binding sensory domain FIST
VAAEAQEALAGKVDVVFAFFTDAHREDAESLAETLWLELDPQALVGCSAEGVIGAGREIERSAGLVLLAGSVPGVRLHAFHVPSRDWHDVLEDKETFAERIGSGPETRGVIAFGDPFTTPLNPVLEALNDAAPAVPLAGGMASAARTPGGNVLVHNDAVYADGMVGLSLSGPVRVETVVSQGCRPVGRPMVITRSRENVIEQLGGRPAMEMLRDTVTGLEEAERQKLANGLFLGRAVSEYRETFGRGDFLVRSVTGVDQENGSLAVNDYVRTGQTVQFHVRDAATASEDLSSMLEARAAREAAAAGGLLFSCNGRGSRMFQSACHDAGAAQRAMPGTPVAGFFAAGEFGPVGGKNFIHGHTASFALFRPGG